MHDATHTLPALTTQESAGMAVSKRMILVRFEFCQTNAYAAFGPIALNITDCEDEEDVRRVFVQEMSRTAHYGENLSMKLADWHDLAFHFQGQEGAKCLGAIDLELLKQIGPKTIVSAHVSSPDGTPDFWTTNGASRVVSTYLHAESTLSVRSDDSEMSKESPYWKRAQAKQKGASPQNLHDKQQVSRALLEEMEEPSTTDDDETQNTQPLMLTKWLKRKDCDGSPGSSTSPLPAKKPRTGLAIESSTTALREAVLSPGIKAVKAADQDDGCRYVRVGERVDDFASAEQAIDKHNIVVAVVNPAVDKAGGKPQVVKYIGVDTYKINGIEVGDYDSADHDLILGTIEFCPDEYWRRILAEMGASRGVAANLGDLNYAVIKYSNQTPDGRRPRTDPRPRKTPLRPRHNLNTWTNTTMLNDRHRGDISAVITFVNDVANVELGLPRNLQAGLDYDEDFSSFKKYILSQRGHHGSLQSMFTDDDSPIDYWADIRIWVLPTFPDKINRELYEWTESSGKLAKDFLDKSNVKEHGRNLFIEIRIVEDADAERKDAEWVQRMTTATVSTSKHVRTSSASPARTKNGDGKTKRPSWKDRKQPLVKSTAKSYADLRGVSYPDMGGPWDQDHEHDQDDEEMIVIKAEPGED